MSKQGQRFRAIKDDTAKPTLFKPIQSQTFLQDETVLSYVDEFINNHPSNTLNNTTNNNNTTTYSGINPTVLSQLNRMQRSLRGLPPLFDDVSTTNTTNTTNNNTISTPSVNKKVVFDE